MSDENKVTVTLPRGQIASAIVNAVVKKKPIGWSPQSFATYYTEPYARWIQRELDEMIITRQDKVFPYEAFKGISANSLYLRVNQAIRFLLDNLDHDGTYKQLKETLHVKRVRGCGVVLEFDKVLEGGARGQSFVKPSDKPKWMQELEEYLDKPNPNGQPFHKSNLLLDNLEVEKLKLELDGLANVIFSVTNREVKVVKGV